MSSLKRNESIRVEISWVASGIYLVRTQIARTTPRAGRLVVADLNAIRMPDFPYESSPAYLAKRVRNAVYAATSDPELEL